MTSYRCYFFGGDNRIRAAEEVPAETVGEAVEIAREMLRQRSQHDAIELWEGERKLYRSPPRRERPGRQAAPHNHPPDPPGLTPPAAAPVRPGARESRSGRR